MKNYLEYKEYIGTIQFSAEDRVFYGKLEAINDLVTFEGVSVDELESNFKESVDDYLETCKDLGKVPEKTFKGNFNVRVNKVIHKKLYLIARKRGINLNQLIQKSVSYTVEHEDLVLNDL